MELQRASPLIIPATVPLKILVATVAKSLYMWSMEL